MEQNAYNIEPWTRLKALEWSLQRFGRTTRNAVALFSAYVKLIRSLDRQQEMHADDFLLKGLE
ncbi:hypothetical protein QJS10_CPA09g00961 [Acorus calamus]|uniref:Uncharacterized protein n=1 Tax=Acorus calamus TaxID=4465 RepID=A0AAV9E6Z0_ACOCL|nr:hypothetical protein QJS10_CPA09g00961 [Acorus calamus]